MKNLLLFLFSALGLSHLANAQVVESPFTTKAPEEKVGDYVRYVPAQVEGEPDVLQTAVVRFTKGSSIIDLVAVVHLGDSAYFENLNQLLKGYDSVLYELVGGKYEDRQQNQSQGLADASNPLSSVSNLQSMAKDMLGLDFQLDSVNYNAPNFVHADVNWEQYQELMTAKQESLSTILTRAMALAGSGEIAGLPTDDESMKNMFSTLVSAITTGNSSDLKRTIAPFLSEAEELITKLEGEEGTVLVGERNKVVMQKLEASLAESQGRPQKIAIFYGAGHMPDFEKRFLERGYAKGVHAWANAWEIDDQPTDPTAPHPAASLIQNLVEDNPEIISLLQQVGKALQEAE